MACWPAGGRFRRLHLALVVVCRHHRNVQYEHTQAGRTTLLVAVFLIIIGAVSLPAIYDEDQVSALILLAAIVVVLFTVIVFNRLTVIVAYGAITAKFGWGWPKRSHAFVEIAGIRQVRNACIYGWGSRWIPGGWMYNVWGRDAVELALTSGQRFRIGTDEPERLLAALPQELVRQEL